MNAQGITTRFSSARTGTEHRFMRAAAVRQAASRAMPPASDKRYSFRLLADQPTDSVHLFEAAIDLLSYVTYLKCQEKDYRAENLLSLSGVYQPQKNISESRIPIALEKFLAENPQIHTVILHLHNDRAGRWSTAALKIIMRNRWEIIDDPPPRGKDFNDFLQIYLGIPVMKTSRESVR